MGCALPEGCGGVAVLGGKCARPRNSGWASQIWRQAGTLWRSKSNVRSISKLQLLEEAWRTSQYLEMGCRLE